ncbi:MAG: hypothetical protein QM685_07120 [Paraburkholderia sp.]
MSVDARGQAGQLGVQLRGFVNEIACAPQHDRARGRNFNATCSPGQKAMANALFDFAYALADRGRNDVLAPCSSGDTSFFNNGDKKARCNDIEEIRHGRGLSGHQIPLLGSLKLYGRCLSGDFELVARIRRIHA